MNFFKSNIKDKLFTLHKKNTQKEKKHTQHFIFESENILFILIFFKLELHLIIISVFFFLN